MGRLRHKTRGDVIEPRDYVNKSDYRRDYDATEGEGHWLHAVRTEGPWMTFVAPTFKDLLDRIDEGGPKKYDYSTEDQHRFAGQPQDWFEPKYDLTRGWGYDDEGGWSSTNGLKPWMKE